MAKARKATNGPRIRSGGQTGVDRAALDAAMAAGWPYEGWCPKGGLAEDFVDPPGLLTKYPCLQETPSEVPKQRTEWNVRDSMATVVLVPHAQFSSPGTEFTIACAKKYGRPCTIIRYLDQGAAAELKDVISSLQSTSLNIAGPRESEHPGAYDLNFPLLVRALRACQKWEPVLRPDTRQNKELEQEDHSKNGPLALGAGVASAPCPLNQLKSMFRRKTKRGFDKL